MTASIYRTVTNEIVKGEIIKSQSQQDMLIIQDKKIHWRSERIQDLSDCSVGSFLLCQTQCESVQSINEFFSRTANV